MQFDPSQLTLTALPSIAFEMRRDLPSCQGIYFAATSDTILYIGKAKNLNQRWIGHHRKADVAQWEGVVISWLTFDGPADLLDEIERACILYFAPVLNERSIKAPPQMPQDCMLKLRVREIAEAQGITDPVALAGKTKIAYATAYRLWQGQLGSEDRGVGVMLLYRVAQALGVKLSELLVEQENAPGQWVPELMAA